MKLVRCPNCGFVCKRNGKTNAGSQRWYCNQCSCSFTNKVNKTNNNLQIFLDWLFGKHTQLDMAGDGRSFRRKTSQFWELWLLPPKVESSSSVVFVDGIYLARNACILICCNETHVLGWYVCRYEHSKAWEALLRRISSPIVVISDGGTGFQKALKKVWPKAKLQRCLFHVFQQVKRYTTIRPKTIAGCELYGIARDLLTIHTQDHAVKWVQNVMSWKVRHRVFLSEMTVDENGTIRPKHERLIKAENSLVKLINNRCLFTYLDTSLRCTCPATNNCIEGGINAQLRAMLRNHRGMSIERRIKAVFWWCYMHSPNPLSNAEILKVMPTNKSISDIYHTIHEQSRLEASIPTWGDAIVWSDLHNYDCLFTNLWGLK